MTDPCKLSNDAYAKIANKLYWLVCGWYGATFMWLVCCWYVVSVCTVKWSVVSKMHDVVSKVKCLVDNPNPKSVEELVKSITWSVN